MSNVDNANPLSFLINQNDPNVNMQLRQRLALALLSRNKGAAPKNIGEGIFSAANSITDALVERGVLGQDAAAQAAGAKTGAELSTQLPPPVGSDQPVPAVPPPAPPPRPTASPQARAFTAPGPVANAPQPAPDAAASPPAQAPSVMSLAATQPDAVLGPNPMRTTPPPPQQPQAQPASMLTQPPMGPPRGDGTVSDDVNVGDPNDPWAGRSRSIAGIESGGARNPYSLMGAQTRTGDRAIGKYQVMGANVPEWTKAALGTAMTPEQFKNDSAAQEAVFRHRFGQYVDKYGEEGAARAWFGGEKGMKNLSGTDVHGRLTVGTYGQDYMRRLGLAGQPPGSRDRIAAAAPPVNGSGATSPPPTALTDPNASATSPALPAVITDGPGSRASLTRTLAAQQAPPAPAGPAVPAGPVVAQATGIQKAPNEAAVPGYITPEPGPLPTRRQAEIPPQERALEQRLLAAKARGNPYEIQQIEAVLGKWQERRAFEQANIDNADKRAAELAKEKALETERSRQTATGRIDTHEKEREAIEAARDANRLRQQFANLPPEQVFKKLDESHKMARAGADGLTASSAAMDAFSKGAITGFGADAKLNLSKLLTGMGLVDKGDVIANTETFRSAMAPVVGAIMHQTSGATQLSEGELAFAKAAAAGNITLDAKSIQRLVSIIDKRSREVLADHQKLTGAMIGENPKQLAVYGVETPNVPHNFASEADAAKAGLKPGTRVRINGRVGVIE
jgi:hypothetical protein